MESFHDIILYQPESEWVEFKRDPYTKETHAELLKDLIGLANAHSQNSRYLIIGVKLFGIRRTFQSLPEPTTDEASFRQLIIENIEPELPFRYKIESVEGNTVAVFELFDCSGAPFQMRKNYGKYKKGDRFMRKGTSTGAFTREDEEQVYKRKYQKPAFTGPVTVEYSVNGILAAPLKRMPDVQYPSDKEWDRIQAEIRKLRKEIELTLQPDYLLTRLQILQDQLENVTEHLMDENRYFEVEQLSCKLNFIISNNADSYLRDTTVEIILPKIKGIQVETRQHATTAQRVLANTPKDPGVTVQRKSNALHVLRNIKTLKHHLPTQVLETSLRILIDEDYQETEVLVLVNLYAENLPKPYQYQFAIPIEVV